MRLSLRRACALPRPSGRLGVLLTVLFLLGAGTTAAAAQDASVKTPKRPHLAADRDTNSAVDYFSYGVSILGEDPYKAASAFFWATRLDPSWADPIYGEYAASLMAEPTNVLLEYYTRRDLALRDPALRHVDSLVYRALLKNPFVNRQFEGAILNNWISRIAGGNEALRDLEMRDRPFAAWSAYARGDFHEAASIYANVIKKYPDDPDLRMGRALSLYSLGLTDSARLMVQGSLQIEHKAETDYSMGWVSHAFAEFSVGILFELVRQRDSASAAYERALLDDVSLHPAHRRLAMIRLAANDTAGALDEYTQAVTLAPEDAGYLYEFGVLLVGAGRPDSGVVMLRRAVTAEPFFAMPHFPLAVMYERSGFADEAVEHYTAFLQLAPRTLAPAIAAARQHLEALHPAAAKP